QTHRAAAVFGDRAGVRGVVAAPGVDRRRIHVERTAAGEIAGPGAIAADVLLETAAGHDIDRVRVEDIHGERASVQRDHDAAAGVGLYRSGVPLNIAAGVAGGAAEEQRAAGFDDGIARAGERTVDREALAVRHVPDLRRRQRDRAIERHALVRFAHVDAGAA